MIEWIEREEYLLGGVVGQVDGVTIFWIRDVYGCSTCKSHLGMVQEIEWRGLDGDYRAIVTEFYNLASAKTICEEIWKGIKP